MIEFEDYVGGDSESKVVVKRALYNDGSFTDKKVTKLSVGDEVNFTCGLLMVKQVIH